MYICVCRSVTDDQIRQAVQDGASTLTEVSQMTGAASNCGTCGPAARDVIQGELANIEQQYPEALYYRAS